MTNSRFKTPVEAPEVHDASGRVYSPGNPPPSSGGGAAPYLLLESDDPLVVPDRAVMPVVANFRIDGTIDLDGMLWVM